jgi:hypothetical protein
VASVYRALGTHEVLVYIILTGGALFAFRWLWRSWSEWRRAVYSLEKEFALRRMGQATATVALVFVLFCGEVVTASFVLPGLPADVLVSTATPDLRALPTGTVGADLATEIAATGAAPSTPGGCVAGSIEIASPKSGQEISGTLDIRGTVDIPQFGFYKYEVAPAGSDAWSTISAGRDRIRDGSLGQWDTSAATPGDYQLRLIVTDNQGRALPACVVQVRVSAPG